MTTNGRNAADQPVPEVIANEMAKDRELRREERRALTSIPAVDLAEAPQRATFLPQSLGEAMQFASLMARSNFVPVHLRGKDGDCMAIVMQAARWGMDPFAVANKSYFTKDGAPPAFEAQLVNAVVNSSGALNGRLRVEFSGEGEALRCTVRGYLRADPDHEKTQTQAIARIRTRNSPLWKDHPEQQLGYYTTRAWARLHCPEVLMGVYTPDELMPEPIVPDRPRPTRESVALASRSDIEIGAPLDIGHGREGELVEHADGHQGSEAQHHQAADDDHDDRRDDAGGAAVDLPTNEAEWIGWRLDLEEKLEKAQTMQVANDLFRSERPRIDASPDRDEIMGIFTDRIAELADAGGDN